MRRSKAKEFSRQMMYFARVMPKVPTDVLLNVSMLAERYERAMQLSMVHRERYTERRIVAWKRLKGYCEFNNLKVFAMSGGRAVVKMKYMQATVVPLEMYCEAL